MPLYEYECKVCGETFETLVFGSSEVVTCPTCESEEVRKRVSTVASVGSGCVSTGTGFT